MGYEAKIWLDSVSPAGHRLVTFEVTYPRFVLSEFNTHRVLSRNSASSRAIPAAKSIIRALSDPFFPIHWGKNQSGMQAEEELDADTKLKAMLIWDRARGQMAQNVQELIELGVHKQVANRLLEPFMWHTVIVTATAWNNFFALRTHPDAQPEIREIAVMMQKLYGESQPTLIAEGDWHLPLVGLSEDNRADFSLQDWIKISAGRCARVSYLTHDGRRDPRKDIELYERLASSGHMSPLEHAARPMTASEFMASEWSGNFHGWHQYRKDIPNEDDFAKVLASR